MATDSRPLSRTLLALGGILFALTLPLHADAQDEDEPDAVVESEEVDVNEDTYRAFMELDDRDIQRARFSTQPAPMNTPRSLTGLPEASQRHLREQLRDIIVGRGPWTPAEADADYPYVPSAAAAGDPALRQREAKAWNELVGEYHEREAALYAGGQGGGQGAGQEAAASQGDAAAASAQAAGSTSASSDDSSSGQDGAQGQQGQDGQSGESGESGESGQDSNSAERSTSERDAQASQSQQQRQQQQSPVRSNRPPTEGVSQSALEYLTGQPAEQPAQPSVSRPQAPTDQQGSGDPGLLTLEELERARGLQRLPVPPPAEPEEDEPPQSP